jgi:probable rRNA maturation factor
MIHLQISEIISPTFPPTVMEQAAAETLAAMTTSDQVDLTILLTDDGQIHQLNREYLAIDAPTDVLAFPADYIDPDTENRYLGDVIISYERAVVQAQAGDHALEQEIELLVVHGILHLLGHDHADPDQKAKMWAAQAEILARLRNPISPS